MQKHEAIQLLNMVRVHIVLGGVLAFTLGMLLAVAGGGTFNPLTALLFYSVVFFGDLSAHYSNDYFDYNQDQQTQSLKFFSGKRILIQHPNLLPTARITALICFSASILLACLAVATQSASLELLLIAVGANLLGWFYSAKPLRLVSRGLGEIAIALAAGFAIPAVGYMAVQGGLDALFGYFVLPFVLYGFMLGLSLEAPDVEVDRKSDKITVGTRWGAQAVFELILVVALLALAVFVFFALCVEAVCINFWVIAVFSTVPLAAAIAGALYSRRKANLNVFSAINISALFAFNLLMVGYLAIESLRLL